MFLFVHGCHISNIVYAKYMYLHTGCQKHEISARMQYYLSNADSFENF